MWFKEFFLEYSNTQVKIDNLTTTKVQPFVSNSILILFRTVRDLFVQNNGSS